MNILVSGSNGNLGHAVVKKFCEENHKVYGLTNDTDQFVHENFQAYTVDLMNSGETRETTAKVKEKAGEIEVAVLTVGGFAMGSIEDTDIDAIQKQISLNFHTAYNVVKALYDSFSANARLFLIGAKPALSADSMKEMVSYTLAKKLIFALADIINAERKDGLQAHVVVPSIIDTPPNRDAMKDQDFSKWIKPEEIAETILFYATNKYLNGSILKTYAES